MKVNFLAGTGIFLFATTWLLFTISCGLNHLDCEADLVQC
jgi:hypothetical protein